MYFVKGLSSVEKKNVYSRVIRSIYLSWRIDAFYFNIMSNSLEYMQNPIYLLFS